MPTPAQSATPTRDPGKLAALVTVVIAAVLALSYAVWAFTARHGIFADFADGNPVSTDDAKSSDNIDSVLLIAAGLLAIIALAVWIMLATNRKTSGGPFDFAGLATVGIGMVVVLLGLLLSNGISDGTGQADQGDKGATATLVIGGGFLLLAIGFLVGVFAIRGSRDEGISGYSSTGPAGYQNW
jgi:hypothetical protein